MGATTANVAWCVAGRSLGSVLIGTAAGLAIAAALARLIASLLFGIAVHDPLSFALPPIALATAALLAMIFPVWRAARIDPARTLREG